MIFVRYLVSIFLFTLAVCLAVVVEWTKGPLSPAQPAAVNVSINVVNAALPVTVGVPVGEKAAVLDAAQLGVTDAKGAPVPARMRVLARWRGAAGDAGKPIKWLLVDFKPAAAGVHFLRPAARAETTPLTAPVTVVDAGAVIRLANSQLRIEFSKQGAALIRGFNLGGGETLRAPITIQTALPRRALVTRTGSSPDALIVTDATLLEVGDEVRFEHTDVLRWDASSGSRRLVTGSPHHGADRIYRIDEGTPRQEDVTIKAALPGDLQTATQLKFSHGAGATIRDLTAEREVARIKSISGQSIQFTSTLKQAHGNGEMLFIAGAANETAVAVIERASIEESNALRAVVRQDGYFRTASRARAPATLAFTLRYYAYADQPFIRVRFRMVNRGAYGFGSSFTNQPPYAQHAVLRGLSVNLPTAAGAGVSQVLSATEAHARLARKQSGASLVAGAFEISVPEFVENYPKALRGDAKGLRFDILPETGGDYLFDGARAKTTDFYLGRNTIAARALTTQVNATLDPAYVAGTGAVRPVMIEKRNWASAFPGDPQLAEAATRVERMFAASYAVEATEGGGAVPPMSAFEYREASQNGEQFGWRHFGDLAWGDGYANVHYDLPFVVLREYLRTGDGRAYALGGEMARYRADWGQHHADDYLNVERITNFKGMAFYEKGDHGSFREPVPSHVWTEGMWLYWALTGDEAVRESAVDASHAFLRMDFKGSLGTEARWYGWPVLGLVTAYRYAGEARYLSAARDGVNMFLRAESSEGKRGYTRGGGPDGEHKIQAWGWSYSLLGVIEYWRDTGDKATADFLVRVADWMVGTNNKTNPPIKPGRTLADGRYLPYGVSYFWSPDATAEDRGPVYAGMTLPVLVTAARITGRADLWNTARLVFRDFAFYRDLTESNPVPPQARHVINFRSLMYPASVPKVYGQMGLTVAEYLPELVNARRPAATPTPAPKATASPKPL